MPGTCQDQTGGDLDDFTPVPYLKGHYWKVFCHGSWGSCKHQDSTIALIAQLL